VIAGLVRRFLFGASLVVAVSFTSFCAFGLSLDPTWQLALNPNQGPRHALQARYHLTEPILTRYWLWVKELPEHGFGTTVMPLGGLRAGTVEGTPIGSNLASAAGVTAELIGVALVLTLLLSLALGAWTGLRRTPAANAVRVLSYVAWSVPSFLIAVVLLLLVPDVAHWFPPGRPGGGTIHWLRQILLPAATLAVALVGLYARYVRSAIMTASTEPYAVVARAKGLAESQVVRRHLLRNSLIPLVSVLSLDIAGVVGISLAVDTVYGKGGLAGMFLAALSASDPFLLTAILVAIAALVAAFVFVADAVVVMLDPRLRRS